MIKSVEMPREVMDNLLKNVINPWLLGADPEWAVIMPPDAVVVNSGDMAVNTTKAAGSIGSDHNGRVWELRPGPSPSAYVVATNLWKLLRQTELNKIERFKWKSGGLGAKKHPTYVPGTTWATPNTLLGWIQLYSNTMYGMNQQQAEHAAQQAFTQQQQLAHQQQQQLSNDLDTLGGHVHFGIAGFNPAQRGVLNKVTTGMLNLDILPQKENTKRLSITSYSSPMYGHFDGGDAVRDCNGHVEYRCAPSWLDRPGQALAALTIYKLAAARPSSVKWPEDYSMKAGLQEWLVGLSGDDVDAWILAKFVEEHGFSEVQADPSSDFKSRWRRENPWEGS